MIIKEIFIKVLYILLLIYLSIFIPTFWGYKPLVIISGSMEPVLKVGGILYYKEIKLDEYAKDDIVVYKSNKYLISHRIVEIKDNGFKTKGDANKNIDSNLLSFNKVLGKGTNWSIPYIGYYADFVYKNKRYLYITLIILVINFIISNYVGEENEKNNKNNISNNSIITN